MILMLGMKRWLSATSFLLVRTSLYSFSTTTTVWAQQPHEQQTPQSNTDKDHDNQGRLQNNGIPKEMCQPFGAYPNVLGVTEQDRASFHPVVKFPMIWGEIEMVADDETTSTMTKRVKIPNVSVADYTKPAEFSQLATEEERKSHQQKLNNKPKFLRLLQKLPLFQPKYSRQGRESISTNNKNNKKKKINQNYGIGRYDENRVAMYESDMFHDLDYSVDGYQGARTVHVGIDLGGQVGTKVHAFANGTLHSVGYNPALGDYGHVVVIHHKIPSSGKAVWALYGHLDASASRNKQAGQIVQKGQVVGRLGDIHENGGWFAPHVHFQLSTEPPETHDMPGAVAVEDRPKALLQYPDPRWVLGPLY